MAAVAPTAPALRRHSKTERLSGVRRSPSLLCSWRFTALAAIGTALPPHAAAQAPPLWRSGPAGPSLNMFVPPTTTTMADDRPNEPSTTTTVRLPPTEAPVLPPPSPGFTLADPVSRTSVPTAKPQGSRGPAAADTTTPNAVLPGGPVPSVDILAASTAPTTTLPPTTTTIAATTTPTTSTATTTATTTTAAPAPTSTSSSTPPGDSLQGFSLGDQELGAVAPPTHPPPSGQISSSAAPVSPVASVTNGQSQEGGETSSSVAPAPVPAAASAAGSQTLAGGMSTTAVLGTSPESDEHSGFVEGFKSLLRGVHILPSTASTTAKGTSEGMVSTSSATPVPLLASTSGSQNPAGGAISTSSAAPVPMLAPLTVSQAPAGSASTAEDVPGESRDHGGHIKQLVGGITGGVSGKIHSGLNNVGGRIHNGLNNVGGRIHSSLNNLGIPFVSSPASGPGNTTTAAEGSLPVAPQPAKDPGASPKPEASASGFVLPVFTPKPTSREKEGGKGWKAWMFDPLQLVQEILVVLVLVIVLVILWQQRSRVLVLLTGEDRVHATPLDCVWWTFFRCCGHCHHEWTRVLTSCPCCPQRLRGRNAVKVAGTALGVCAHSVEISNIVVGDLPFMGKGSFYLSFECAHNPPMRTSMADMKSPKIVHFPEVITLRLRFSPLEPMVKIIVYELNLIGSEQLCSVSLNAENIILWSTDPANNTKRFAMKVSKDVEVETPPWILLEVNTPRNDVRNLESLSTNITTVRTAAWTNDVNSRASGTLGTYSDMGMKPFKHKYQLVDNYGNQVVEPLEDDLWKIECYRNCLYGIYNLLSLVVTFSVGFFLILRFYAWSCWRKYRFVTLALRVHPDQTNRTYTTAMLQHISDACAQYVSEHDVVVGQHPCKPTTSQIKEKCDRLPAGQETPTAFTGFIQRYAGQDVKGVPCMEGICDAHLSLKQYDLALLIGCVIAILWVGCLLRPCINMMIEKRKRRIISGRARR